MNNQKMLNGNDNGNENDFYDFNQDADNVEDFDSARLAA